VSGQIDAQTELPQRKNPDTHLIRDWLGYRADQDVSEKR
jgi:hypothetical protein